MSLLTFLTLFSSKRDSFLERTGAGSGSGSSRVLIGVSTTKIMLNFYC
jgi:hypothetical protein